MTSPAPLIRKIQADPTAFLNRLRSAYPYGCRPPVGSAKPLRSARHLTALPPLPGSKTFRYSVGMLFALLLVAAAADWVPARWPWSDPATLELLAGTPVNCLLVERPAWDARFNRQARIAGVATLGVIREETDPVAATAEAVELDFTGVVYEGDFPRGALDEARKVAARADRIVVELVPRTSMRLESADVILGTFQGVWPGINLADDGSAKAAPTGSLWIDTNTGFLRFLRAMTEAEIWLGNLPPAGTVIPLSRYLQAIADAAMVGGRWIVAFDDDFAARLARGDAAAIEDWRRIGRHLAYWQQHRAWREYRPYGGLAIIHDVQSGALLSNGILDMVSARHTPLRSIPIRRLSDEAIAGARMAVSVDPAALEPEQKEILRRFTRSGASLLSAPPGWKFPPIQPGQMSVDKNEVARLDDIWRGVNSMVGRENLGVRLFNVSSMRSELVAAPGGRPVVLHLVNYADYPVEHVTVHLLDKFEKARLLAPEAPPKTLEVYPHGEGSGVDIDLVRNVATLMLE